MLGERLKLARKKAGLSLRDLSDRMQGPDRVSAQALGKYERGEMTPGSGVLIALSKALGEPVRYFMSPIGARLLEVDFRKKAATSARDRARVEAAVLEHVERYLAVEEILELDSAHWTAPGNPMELSSMDEAETLAEQVREHWKLGGDPIPDLAELLEERGIKVLVIALPVEVSGLTCLVARTGNAPPVPVIVVNAAHSIERRGMTLAQELAHQLSGPSPSVDEEKAAMRFAGAFLMPAAHLEMEVGRRFERLCFRALSERRISPVKAAELLGKPYKEIRQAMRRSAGAGQGAQ